MNWTYFNLLPNSVFPSVQVMHCPCGIIKSGFVRGTVKLQIMLFITTSRVLRFLALSFLKR